MAISLTCPDCQSGYELPDEDAGQLVECPCGAVLTVPGNKEPQIEVRCPKCGGRYFLDASAAGTLAECACGQQLKVGQVTAPRAPDTGETIPLKCPGCSTRYNVPIADAGQQVECPCGSKFRIPRDAARLAAELKERRRKKQEAAASGASATASSTTTSDSRSPGAKFSPESTSVIPPDMNPLLKETFSQTDSQKPADAKATTSKGTAEKRPVEKPSASDSLAGKSSAGKSKGASSQPKGNKSSSSKKGRASGDAASSTSSGWRSKASKLTADAPIGGAEVAPFELPLGLPEETFTDRHGGALVGPTSSSGNSASKGAPTPATGPLRLIMLSLAALLAVGGVIGFFVMQAGDQGKQNQKTVAQSDTPKTPPTGDGASGQPTKTGSTTTVPGGTSTNTANPNTITQNTTPPENSGTDGNAKTGTTPAVPPETTTPETTTPPTSPSTPIQIEDRPLAKAPLPEKQVDTSPAAINEVLTSIPPEVPIESFRDGLQLVGDVTVDLEIVQAELLETNKEKPELKAQYVDLLRRSAGALEATLKKIDSFATLEQVIDAERLLAYMYHLMNQHDRAVVLASYVARKAEDDGVAENAARIAFASQIQEWLSSTEANRESTVRTLVNFGEMIEKRWPKEEENLIVRMTIANAYRTTGDYLEAVKWYQRVGNSDPNQYAVAQIIAGQILWNLFENIERQADEQTDPAATRQLRTLAAERLKEAAIALRNGVNIISKEKTPDIETLIRAKLSLAQAELKENHPDTALKLLTAEPHSVLKAVDIKAGTKRPEQGLQSKPYAVTTYRAIMLAQVAMNQIDEAIKTIDNLEKLSEGNVSSLTGLYTQLIRQMRSEMEAGTAERKEVLGPAVHLLLGKVRAIPDVSESVRLWSAEQELFVAENVSAEQAVPYFAEAAGIYEAYLKNLQSGVSIPKEDTVISLRQKIADTKRRSGQHFEAAASYYELLKLRPNTFLLQANMALCLEEAGRKEGQKELLMVAIQGGWKPEAAATEPAVADGSVTSPPATETEEKKSPVWGWGTLSSYLSKKYRDGVATDEDKERLLEARYHIARCRFEYYRADSGEAGKTQLEQARLELEAFASLHTTLESPGWGLVEGIYAELLAELGVPEAKLRQPPPTDPS